MVSWSVPSSGFYSFVHTFLLQPQLVFTVVEVVRQSVRSDRFSGFPTGPVRRDSLANIWEAEAYILLYLHGLKGGPGLSASLLSGVLGEELIYPSGLFFFKLGSLFCCRRGRQTF